MRRIEQAVLDRIPDDEVDALRRQSLQHSKGAGHHIGAVVQERYWVLEEWIERPQVVFVR